MRHFDEIFDIAADRKGGAAALEDLLAPPTPSEDLKALGDDRWLAGATKSIFNAGFNWKVVDSMWPGFEAAFNRFDIYKCANLDYEDFDRLTQDRRIVRYGVKIKAVQENAVFFLHLADAHGSAANAIVDWPATDYVGLLDMLKKRGTRLGGTTAQ
ncbi:MAG: DNA-3-methyladenine glycosylase I [Pseudomonadota bacterium]